MLDLEWYFIKFYFVMKYKEIQYRIRSISHPGRWPKSFWVGAYQNINFSILFLKISHFWEKKSKENNLEMLS